MKRLTISLCAVLASGCFGAAKPVEFYTLRPVASVGSPAPASSAGLGIAVGPIQLPKYLDRPELVLRDGEHRLTLDEWHRWGGSLRTDILRVVADDLGTLLDTSRIAVYPAEPRFPLDYRILIDVHEFEGTFGKSVRLRVYWSVLAGDVMKAVDVEASVVEQPVASESWADFVAAYSAALGTVTQEIAARLRTLETHKPSPARRR